MRATKICDLRVKTLKIYLASASSRRIEILTGLKLDFTVLPGNCDEEAYFASHKKFKSLAQIIASARLLAGEKASSVGRKIPHPALIIGADTIVVSGKTVLGKPENQAQAKVMLEMLAGKKHYVVTGIALFKQPENTLLLDHETTEVWFNPLSPEEITAYLATGEWRDKAGAYGIQGFASLLVEKIKGCYFNVVGLPVNKLNRNLKQFQVNLLKAGTS